MEKQQLYGDFYIGVDLGKKRDYSVVAVIRKDGDVLKLVFMKRFKLGTPYASVIGYVKVLSDRLSHVRSIFVDQTGVGEYIVEDMQKSGLGNVEGVTLTVPVKQDILGFLKTKMQTGQLFFPYDSDLIAEINVERFELTKSGQIQFSHPDSTHDDRLWALALAVYATRGAPVKFTATPGSWGGFKGEF